jgi:hypothetical protein
MILYLVYKFNDTIRYNTVQYGTVRYQSNLIYVRFFTSNHEICADRRPLPFDSCEFHSFDCRDMLVWKTHHYLPQELSTTCQPSSHPLRLQHNADHVWEPEALKLILFSPFDLKGSLVRFPTINYTLPEYTKLYWHINTSIIQIISTFLWTTCVTSIIVTICSKKLQIMCTSYDYSTM